MNQIKKSDKNKGPKNIFCFTTMSNVKCAITSQKRIHVPKKSYQMQKLKHDYMSHIKNKMSRERGKNEESIQVN